jgi:hypothetical protein
MIASDPEFALVSADKPLRVKLTSDYCVVADNEAEIVVPAGFTTDLASVPRLFWSIPGFSPVGHLVYGAIVHDFGYQYGYLLAKRTSVPFSGRSNNIAQAYPEMFKDLIPVVAGRERAFFDSLLKAITVDKTGRRFIAGVAHAAVAQFGGSVWRYYRTVGPSAYSTNSLGLPGVTVGGLAI